MPELTMNLLSPRQVTNKGFKVELSKESCAITENGEEVMTGKTKEDFWVMELDIVCPKKTKACLVQTLKKWHERLGHQNKQQVKNILKKFGIEYQNEDYFCEACVNGKQTRLPFPSTGTKSTYPGEIVHSDVCEMDKSTLGGSRYYVIFKDDYSHYRVAYTLKHKNEVQDKLKIYLQLIKNQTGNLVKVLRSDRGKEYMNGTVKNFWRKLVSSTKQQLGTHRSRMAQRSEIIEL